MTSRRIGVNNVSKTDYDNHYDYYHNSHEKEEREKEVGKRRIRGKNKEVQRTEALPDLWQTTMSEHIDTRNKLKGIADISSFTSLINSSTLSDIDKQIVVLHYIDEKDFRYIGDMLGYSESTIKRRHKKALIKISKLL